MPTVWTLLLREMKLALNPMIRKLFTMFSVKFRKSLALSFALTTFLAILLSKTEETVWGGEQQHQVACGVRFCESIILYHVELGSWEEG